MTGRGRVSKRRRTKPKESDVLPKPVLMTIDDVATACGVSRGTVQNWIDQGVLKTRKLGKETSRVVRIHIAEFRRFIGVGGDHAEAV
jgi:excisionase family DNA binding protein